MMLLLIQAPPYTTPHGKELSNVKKDLQTFIVNYQCGFTLQKMSLSFMPFTASVLCLDAVHRKGHLGSPIQIYLPSHIPLVYAFNFHKTTKPDSFDAGQFCSLPTA